MTSSTPQSKRSSPPSRRKVLRILAYDGATEAGLVLTEDDDLYLIEGPVVDGYPYRWIKPVDRSSPHAAFMTLVEDMRRHL